MNYNFDTYSLMCILYNLQDNNGNDLGRFRKYVAVNQRHTKQCEAYLTSLFNVWLRMFHGCNAYDIGYEFLGAKFDSREVMVIP